MRLLNSLPVNIGVSLCFQFTWPSLIVFLLGGIMVYGPTKFFLAVPGSGVFLSYVIYAPILIGGLVIATGAYMQLYDDTVRCVMLVGFYGVSMIPLLDPAGLYMLGSAGLIVSWVGLGEYEPWPPWSIEGLFFGLAPAGTALLGGLVGTVLTVPSYMGLSSSLVLVAASIGIATYRIYASGTVSNHHRFAWDGWVLLIALLPAMSQMRWRLYDLPYHDSLFMTGALVVQAGILANEMGRKTYRDDLTGVLGRMALDERLGGLSPPYTAVMTDIDHFKNFNDTYGHDVGDRVLRQIATVLSETSSGTVYRYGGEEFAIVYPDRDVQEDTELAEELEAVREAVESSPLEVDGESVTVTISVGVSVGANGDDPTAVFEDADDALYHAKENGRNRVSVVA